MRTQTDVVTTLDLLRHGTCEGGEIYRGSTDVLLSERGWQQMNEALAGECRHTDTPPWQHIVSSPLQRCRLFAQTKADEYALPLDIVDDFREMHFGDWEGQDIAHISEQHPEAVAAFYNNPAHVSPPNGESIAQLQARMLPALDQLLEQHRGKHLLLVQHGVTIRALIGWALNMDLNHVTRIDIPYAGISRINVYHHATENFPRLIFMNRSVYRSE